MKYSDINFAFLVFQNYYCFFFSFDSLSPELKFCSFSLLNSFLLKNLISVNEMLINISKNLSLIFPDYFHKLQAVLTILKFSLWRKTLLLL